MARRPDEPPRKRFSKSGHTSHGPRTGPPPYHDAARDPYRSPSPYPPGHPEDDTRPLAARPDDDHTRPIRPRPEDDYTRPISRPRPDDTRPLSAGYGPPARDAYGSSTYHHTRGEATGAPPPTAGAAAASLTRAAISQTNRAAKLVTHKVISASKADGAHESGLTALIWNQVLSYGTDAMITVALAGTVFFSASAHAQRGNVLLYLLITMAPFALIAPIIGPALDRVQHGRRWTMAGTAIGRAILTVVMAGHPKELLVLYPCALGLLVLSKAYAVIRAAAAPRLVPSGMTLTQANARLTIFGLGSTLILGGFIGLVIKITGSYSLGLYLTAIGYAVCAYFAFRLPAQVDSAVAARRHPEEPVRPLAQLRVPAMSRLRGWARRGFDERLVGALQGESALRLLSGLLTIYLAFYIESTAHGFDAAVQLGAVVVAAAAGNFSGTAVGTRIKLPRPEVVILVSVAATAVLCILVAVVFGIVFAVIGMYVTSVANALSKIALDSLIQRDVPETLRSSAFGRSETFLQLAWVIGAAIGVVLPSHNGDGAYGFWVAGPVAAVVAAVVALHQRATARGHAASGAVPRPSDPH